MDERRSEKAANSLAVKHCSSVIKFSQRLCRLEIIASWLFHFLRKILWKSRAPDRRKSKYVQQDKRLVSHHFKPFLIRNNSV